MVELFDSVASDVFCSISVYNTMLVSHQSLFSFAHFKVILYKVSFLLF